MIKIKGTVTPEIAMLISGYDFDVRTVRNNVNLHFDNGHVKTNLVALKLGRNNYEVEVIDDPLFLFRKDLSKGDLLNASEIANTMIRQALKGNDMKNIQNGIESKLKRKNKKNINVTGYEDGTLISPMNCDGAIACSFGVFIHRDCDLEQIVNSLDFEPSSDVMEIGEYYFIQNSFQDTFNVIMAEGKEKYADLIAFCQHIKNDYPKALALGTSRSNKDYFYYDIDRGLSGETFGDFGTIIYDMRNGGFKWAPGSQTIPPFDITEQQAEGIVLGAKKGYSKLQIAKAIPGLKEKIS